ncbi:hypothetical protein [Propionivibrio sp.]|uniref:hypothetical protein n=1 Tax=Propionivibrio sp. TaxID=2212460 RepID=UPI00272ECE0A|nr:hypothetical protein [Propionivibrio sp.]
MQQGNGKTAFRKASHDETAVQALQALPPSPLHQAILRGGFFIFSQAISRRHTLSISTPRKKIIF